MPLLEDVALFGNGDVFFLQNKKQLSEGRMNYPNENRIFTT